MVTDKCEEKFIHIQMPSLYGMLQATVCLPVGGFVRLGGRGPVIVGVLGVSWIRSSLQLII